MNTKLIKSLSVLSLIALLTACGFGGNNDSANNERGNDHTEYSDRQARDNDDDRNDNRNDDQDGDRDNDRDNDDNDRDNDDDDKINAK